MLKKIPTFIRYSYLLFGTKEECKLALLSSFDSLNSAGELTFFSVFKALRVRALQTAENSFSNKGAFFDMPLEYRISIASAHLMRFSLNELQILFDKSEVEVKELISISKDEFFERLGERYKLGTSLCCIHTRIILSYDRRKLMPSGLKSHLENCLICQQALENKELKDSRLVQSIPVSPFSSLEISEIKNQIELILGREKSFFKKVINLILRK